MPLQFCHPETPHKKLRIPEWYISSLMLDRSLDAIVRRVKNLDRQHDIPYLAGYSNDGKTIYIDRHMPRTMISRTRDRNRPLPDLRSDRRSCIASSRNQREVST